MKGSGTALTSTLETDPDQATLASRHALTTRQEDLGALISLVAGHFSSLAQALQSISSHARDIAGLSREVAGRTMKIRISLSRALRIYLSPFPEC